MKKWKVRNFTFKIGDLKAYTIHVTKVFELSKIKESIIFTVIFQIKQINGIGGSNFLTY